MTPQPLILKRQPCDNKRHHSDIETLIAFAFTTPTHVQSHVIKKALLKILSIKVVNNISPQISNQKESANRKPWVTSIPEIICSILVSDGQFP